jgi:hypothetical protein
MKKLLLAAATSIFLSHLSHADTSYLLIQGPFGASDAVETFEWKVLYPHGSLNTGLDLLNAVFGQPTDTGTQYQNTYEIFSAGNNVQGAHYIDFGSGGSSLFTISYTLGGKTVEQDGSYSPGWNYYVAGGSGTAGNYDSGAWTYSGDGLESRGLSDGSFDGWVYGNTFPADTISGGTTTFAPTAANFAGATVVPEPASLAFLSLGALLLIRRRR